MRWAVFAPIPLTLFNMFTFSETITCSSSGAEREERIIRAVFGPTPETEINNKNKSH